SANDCADSSAVAMLTHLPFGPGQADCLTLRPTGRFGNRVDPADPKAFADRRARRGMTPRGADRRVVRSEYRRGRRACDGQAPPAARSWPAWSTSRGCSRTNGPHDTRCGPLLGSGDAMDTLAVQGLVKDFRGFRAVDGVDLRVDAETVHALVGPNG